jgi:phosphoglycerate dehydrogenase-like enzyme
MMPGGVAARSPDRGSADGSGLSSGRPAVALMDDYADQARHLPCVRDLAGRVDLTIYTTKAASDAEIADRLRGMEIVITIRDRVCFSPRVLERAPALRLIAVCGPRLAPHVPVVTASELGILISAAPAASAAWATHLATAEVAWSLILGLMKDIVANDRAVREGGWQTRPGRDIAGRTLGIIGAGKVGKQVAAIGRAMQMEVLAWGPRFNPELAATIGVEHASLEDLLARSDIVSLHANLTEESRDLLGTEQLALMRPTALLINTARAGLVNEQALCAALDDDVIAGAGLDVYWTEPLPRGHWIRKHPKVLLQPHVGGFSENGFEGLISPAVESVCAFLNGRLSNVVNPEALARAGLPRAPIAT